MMTCPRCGHDLNRPGQARAFLGLAITDEGDVSRKGRKVRTSPQRLVILRLLHKAKGELVSRERLYEHLYFDRPECDWPDSGAILPQISYLRRELRPVGLTVTNLHGYGYRLEAVDDER